MHLSDGTAADQGRALAIVVHLRAGDLVMRDLGYLSLESLRQIDAHEAWYLSRFSKGVDVYLDAHAETRALAVVPYLQQHYGDAAVVDLPVSLGQERVPCRLLAYRLRWQVELIFKNWKSLLHIHILKWTRPERIKCILYGRLITIAMIALVSSYASWYVEDYLQREMSIAKLINGLKRKSRFAKAIHAGTLDALCIDLWRALPKLLCKQKRRRRTSRQLIEEYGYYMEYALAA